MYRFCSRLWTKTSAAPYNGQLDVSVVSLRSFIDIFDGLNLLFSNRLLKYKEIKIWRTRNIQFNNTRKIPISLDARVVHNPIVPRPRHTPIFGRIKNVIMEQ